MGFFDFLKPVNKVAYIQNKYYRNYPRKPYISPDRDFDDWEKRVSTFPNMIVQPEMMIPYDDGLLPGHIRMLYWIKNIHLDRVPDYFEYEHGINFKDELHVLEENGYIHDGSVTEKGNDALKSHSAFIEKYYPKPKVHGGAEPVKKPLNATDDIEEVIKYINQITERFCRTYDMPMQKINVRILDPEQTHFENLPNTPGRKEAEVSESLTLWFAFK